MSGAAITGPAELALHGVTKGYGAETVIDGLSIRLTRGDRLAIVGPNGIGKSTLLRLMAGLENPTGGRVVRLPASLTVGLVPQELDARPGESALSYLARRSGVAAAGARLAELTGGLEAGGDVLDEYLAALEGFTELGGESFEADARRALSEVGLDARSLGAAADRLSGGEAARLKLAAIVLLRSQVCLLDEPTNDLDFGGLEILEAFVNRHPGIVAVVSHDRALLDATATRILEFEAETHRARVYAGNWTAYAEERERRRAREYGDRGRYVARREALEDSLRRQQTAARGGANVSNRRLTASLSSRTRSLERRLERLDEVEKPWEPWQLELDFPVARRGGDVVVRLEAAEARSGGLALGPLDLEVAAGERILVTGRNGTGKTTLLRAIVGDLELDGGTRRSGPSVTFGYLDQQRRALPAERPVLDAFQRATGAGAEDGRTLLAKFAIGATLVERRFGELSPGERTRVLLASFVAREVNCLVLDEPTNHLDVQAIEQLEQALLGYEGTLVVVSHDRFFIRRLEPDRTLELGA